MKMYVVAVGVLSFFRASVIDAADFGDSVHLSSAVFRGLIVETVYPLKVSQYLNAPVIPTRRSASDQNTPEDTMVEMMSSMKAKDFNWNSTLWSPNSLKDMQARDEKRGKKPADWIKSWEREAAFTYTLLNRVEYGKYVLIEYQATNAEGKSAYKDTMALEKINGKWFLTQALAADPVLAHWNEPSGRVQVASDTIFNK